MDFKVGIRATRAAATKVADAPKATPASVPTEAAGADTFVRLASDRPFSSKAALPDLPAAEGAVDAENVRTKSSLASGAALEELRAFRVGDQLAGLFQEGLLPIGTAGSEGSEGDSDTSGAELSERERHHMLARVLDPRDDSGADDD